MMMVVVVMMMMMMMMVLKRSTKQPKSAMPLGIVLLGCYENEHPRQRKPRTKDPVLVSLAFHEL